MKHNGWSKLRGTYRTWQDMKHRCYNKNSQQFKNYGARGITVCREWRESFENFLRDMGERPEGLTIERINNNGNYEPTNCRWATRGEQRRNQRGCIYLEFNGIKMTVNEWAKKLNFDRETIKHRMKMRYPIEMVLSPKKLLNGCVSPLARKKTP